MDLLLFKALKVKLLFFVFCSIVSIAQSQQNDVYPNVFLLNTSDKIKIVEEALVYLHQGSFSKPLPNTSFQKLKKADCNWMLVKLPASNQVKYLSVGNALFNVVELYSVTNTPSLVSVNHEYRHPVWKINPHVNEQQFLLRVQEKNAGFKVFLNLKIREEQEFLKDLQVESLIFGGLVLGLIILSFFTFFIAFQKKNIGVLFFALNIVFLIVRFFTATGLTSFIGVPKSYVLNSDLHTFAPMISVVSMFYFYYYFYEFPVKVLFFKKIVGVFARVALASLLINILNLFFDEVYNTEFLLQYVILGGIVFCLIMHICLFQYKAIPLYLLIAFLIPFTAIFINSSTHRPLNVSNLQKNLLYNMVYFSKLIECFLVVIFIVKESFKRDLRLNNIEKENLNLKLNLTKNITITENKYRNKLLGDIHDAFGSYIEALSLSLKYKNPALDSDKIIKAFRTEYRMLLNHLHSPNINFYNLEYTILKYCKNLNKVNENCDIEADLSLQKTPEISLIVCNEVYKIITELVINSIKHAKCSKVKITLYNNEHHIKLSIKDNGIGFVIKELELTTFGLKSVKSRVELIKGEFIMDSELNQGTVINIIIPYKNSITLEN